MPQVCQCFVRGVSIVCQRFVNSLPQIVQWFATGLPSMCYISDNGCVCHRFANLCHRFVSGVPQVCHIFHIFDNGMVTGMVSQCACAADSCGGCISIAFLQPIRVVASHATHLLCFAIILSCVSISIVFCNQFVRLPTLSKTLCFTRILSKTCCFYCFLQWFCKRGAWEARPQCRPLSIISEIVNEIANALVSGIVSESVS